jgi:L-ascorbate metabolism protein UlaG (beta-lactamase superfamily)
MNRILAVLLLVLAVTTVPSVGQQTHQSDQLPAAGGNLTLTFLGHGSVMMSQAGKTIYVDPVSRYVDFAQMPKADLILITHEHGDHLDSVAIERLRNEATVVLLTQSCAPFVRGGLVLRNGDTRTISGVGIEAVPAYNLVHMARKGVPFHPKGSGNGYVVSIGGLRIYIAGDTENIPEMSNLGTIDCAFLPMNLPYTMTPEMVAEAAKRIKPRILYPYHFGNTDTGKLVELLKDVSNIEVRIRDMK